MADVSKINNVAIASVSKIDGVAVASVASIAGVTIPSGGNSSALVAGAGSVAANGVYTPRGTSGGKPYYNLTGEPDNPDIGSIVWVVGSLRWKIIGTDENEYYISTDAVDFPWLAVFVVQDGDPQPQPSQKYRNND